MLIESLLKQKTGSNPNNMKVFSDMRRANEEARKALHRSGSPEVCGDLSPHLLTGGTGASEHISEDCLAGDTVGRGPTLERWNVQNDFVSDCAAQPQLSDPTNGNPADTTAAAAAADAAAAAATPPPTTILIRFAKLAMGATVEW